MNTEANKRIHALLGKCWHESEPVGTVHHGGYFCTKCGDPSHLYRVPLEFAENTDYFSESLPDNLRVAMVTAAREKFTENLLGSVVWSGLESAEMFACMEDCLSLPAPAIAEAIDKLLVADDETGRWKTMQTI